MLLFVHAHTVPAQADGPPLFWQVAAGAELNVGDTLGRSPLFISALAAQPACTALMLAARADAEQMMTSHNVGSTPLYAAALAGSTACVGLLCEASVDVNVQTGDGASAMIVASQYGHLKATQLLSSYGASRQRSAFRGCLPRCGSWVEELAKRSGNEELVRSDGSHTVPSTLHCIRVHYPHCSVCTVRAAGALAPAVGRLLGTAPH
jgi:ankyrin repeat protein